MRKALIPLTLALCILLSGCSMVSGLLDGDGLGDLIAGTKYEGDAMYAELASLASNPDKKTDMNSKFSFVCYVATEPF